MSSSTSSRNKRTHAEIAEEGEAAGDKVARSSKEEAPTTTTTNTATAPQQEGPSPHEAANFEHYLCRLILYKMDHGKYSPGVGEFELCDFLKFCRKEFKNKEQGTGPVTLSDDQFRLLDHLNIPVTSRGDDHWNRFFTLLENYKKEHGHVLVPRPSQVAGLGDWVSDQRRQYKMWKEGKTSQLTAERRQKLEEIGFVWQVRDRPAWDIRFNELLEYKTKFGHCKVPQHYKDNKSLGKWVAKQREQYKRHLKGEHTFLTPLRLEKLNEAGFVWSMRATLSEQAKVTTSEEDPGVKEGAEKTEEAEETSDVVAQL